LERLRERTLLGIQIDISGILIDCGRAHLHSAFDVDLAQFSIMVV
jgi:hypothetical protein